MSTDYILKRNDGSEVNINVWIHISIGMDKPYYHISVFTKEKGKRKWQAVHNSDDYSWRRLDQEGRDEYEMNLYLQHVTPDEILKAKEKLWQLLKP